MTIAWENMWTFNTANFRVTWDITPDNDYDLSWDDDDSVREGLETGKYQCFGSRVAVWYDGAIIGEDTLWGSVYENPSEFRDHVGSHRRYGSYFADMIHTAIKEARRNMSKPRPKLRSAT